METPMIDLYRGDCLATLRNLPDNSVDSIVTDPPYGLSNTDPAKVQKALTAWVMGARDYVPEGKGFMGQAWDSFVPPPAVWDECYRVLKPGGHMVVFAGSRTQDLMGMSIRLAGFDVRDSVAWLYGSGFPKSLDVSKAIDKAGGDTLAFRRFARAYADAVKASKFTHTDIDRRLGIKSSSCYWAREDHRGGMPPRHHWEQVRNLMGLDAEFERLYDEAEQEVVGIREVPKGHAFAGSTYGGDSSAKEYADTHAHTSEAAKWSGWGTALKPGHEPIILARKPFPGTVAANVQEHGTGALNIDATRTGIDPAEREVVDRRSGSNTKAEGWGFQPTGETFKSHAAGRWPTNVILDEDQAAALDQQSGNRPGAVSNGSKTQKGLAGSSAFKIHEREQKPGYADQGGASRFFYVAKAGKKERPSYVDEDGNTVAHPTVKPVALIRWLVRLITPPGGTVLEPFAGTGTTGEAAALEGFACIMIERHGPYLPLIRARMDRVAKAEK